MLKLCINKLLIERNKSKYWLSQQVSMSYQNFDKMVNNETSSIKYNVIEQLCDVLNCSISDLFEHVEN